MTDGQIQLAALLTLWSKVVEDDPNTPDLFQDLLEQAAVTLGTGDLETLDADFRALDDRSVVCAMGSFVELYRQLRNSEVEGRKRAMEGANLLVERAEMEAEKRGLAA